MNRRLLVLFACLGVGVAVAQDSLPVAGTNVVATAVGTESGVLQTSPAPSAAAVVGTAGATAPDVETLPMMTYGPEGGGQNLISVSLDDVPLQDVIRLFTRISGANIIASSSNLQGKVTVNLQDVEWKPALGSILDIYSMMIAEKIPGSGIYSIQPKLTEPLIAQSIFLNYASVSNAIAIVVPMVGKEGSVSPFINANALVVRASAANLSDIRKVISEIDQPRKQVYIEAKFLELTDEAIKDLGINWQVLQSYGVGVRGMQWSVQENRDKLKSQSDTLSQTDQRVRTDELNTRYDSAGNQYDETTTINEEQPVGSGNFVSRTVLTPTRSVNDSINQSRGISRQLEDTYTKSVADIRTAVLSADDFKIMLSALKQMNGISIVSNPKIIVANEETASIHIGENEPNIRGTVTPGQQGQANTTTYSLDEQKPYFQFGISVDVTPTINNSSNITVRIVPTLSRFVRNKVAPDNNSYPVEATKTIKTVFSLDSGKTAAIGGLTETQDREVTSKIPLLGDIPLIGKWLFSHTHTQKSQQETIIFVTVGLANPGDIQQNEGLPEDTELTQKLMAVKLAKKTVRDAQAAEAKTNQVAESAKTMKVKGAGTADKAPQ
jgi:type II secretory pathway component GspD/PulD (secretin)